MLASSNWNNTSNTGLSYLNSNNVTTNNNRNIGTRARAQDYVETRLQLKLNPKTRIYPVDDISVDFLGYKTYRTHTLLRKRTVNKFKHKIKEIKNHHVDMRNQHVVSSVMSYVGWMQHGNCYNLMSKYLILDNKIVEIMDRCSSELGHENPLKNKYGDN